MSSRLWWWGLLTNSDPLTPIKVIRGWRWFLSPWLFTVKLPSKLWSQIIGGWQWFLWSYQFSDKLPPKWWGSKCIKSPFTYILQVRMHTLIKVKWSYFIWILTSSSYKFCLSLLENYHHRLNFKPHHLSMLSRVVWFKSFDLNHWFKSWFKSLQKNQKNHGFLIFLIFINILSIIINIFLIFNDQFDFFFKYIIILQSCDITCIENYIIQLLYGSINPALKLYHNQLLTNPYYINTGRIKSTPKSHWDDLLKQTKEVSIEWSHSTKSSTPSITVWFITSLWSIIVWSIITLWLLGMF